MKLILKDYTVAEFIAIYASSNSSNILVRVNDDERFISKLDIVAMKYNGKIYESVDAIYSMLLLYNGE